MATMTINLRFEDPPAEKRQKLVPKLFLMTLEPPGQWVRLGEWTARDSAKVTCQSLRDGRGRKLPEGRFEFKYGELPDPEEGWGVWARYLGPDAP